MKKILLMTLVALFVSLVPNVLNAQNNASQSQNSGEMVITQPEFKGGMEALYKYILTNFEYPEEAAKRSISGTAEVEFTVEKSGDVTNVGLLKGIHELVDDQIIRLLQAMPRWTPATRNGTPVRYKVSMPLTLKLSRNRNGAKSSTGLEENVFDRY
ncbi:MAG: energy transducer TonB [Bacteroidaceae bacterium]|nr:energy transducer TonB [Bacteroidaceae bacterium]